MKHNQDIEGARIGAEATRMLLSGEAEAVNAKARVKKGHSEAFVMNNEANPVQPGAQDGKPSSVCDYWLGAWNTRMGQAVMRTAPGEDSKMVATVLMRKDVAERVGWAIIRELEAVDAGC